MNRYLYDMLSLHDRSPAPRQCLLYSKSTDTFANYYQASPSLYQKPYFEDRQAFYRSLAAKMLASYRQC